MLRTMPSKSWRFVVSLGVDCCTNFNGSRLAICPATIVYSMHASFTHNWKFPTYKRGSLLKFVLWLFTYNGRFFARTVGKRPHRTDCKQRSSTVIIKTPTASQQASPTTHLPRQIVYYSREARKRGSRIKFQDEACEKCSGTIATWGKKTCTSPRKAT